MHELSIAQNILESVRNERERNGWGAVTSIALQVGALAGVHTDSLVFGFDALRADFDLPDCSLHIDTVPLTLSCSTCGQTADTEVLSFHCPKCASTDVSVVKGYELDIVSVDVAVPHSSEPQSP